jgi:hypothetical protein
MEVKYIVCPIGLDSIIVSVDNDTEECDVLVTKLQTKYGVKPYESVANFRLHREFDANTSIMVEGEKGYKRVLDIIREISPDFPYRVFTKYDEELYLRSEIITVTVTYSDGSSYNLQPEVLGEYVAEKLDILCKSLSEV